MTIPEAANTAAGKINRALLQVPSISVWRGRDRPRNYGQILSAIALIASADDIEYVSGRATSEEAFEVVVLTSNLIIHSIAASDDEARTTPRVAIWPRSQVTHLELAAVEPVPGTNPFGDWPGPLTIGLSLKDGPTITVPLERSYADEEQHKLRELVEAETQRLQAR